MGRGSATSQQARLFNDYDAFVEKFKPKKTTDDCYTPPEVYEAVLGYVCERYGVERDKAVRPFRPGGDYEAEEYPDGTVVVDNPPFSILSRIVRFYCAREVPFFLFAPSLTCFGSMHSVWDVCTAVVCGCEVVYDNGAVVPTSFVTNMGGDVQAESCPELTRRVNAACDEMAARKAKPLPKYDYPDEVLTAAKMQWLARHGERLVVRRGDCVRISALDEQRAVGKAVFGSGLLLSERAAAERAAAERAAAERAAAERAAAERAAARKWSLSERERAIQAMLGKDRP